MYSSPSIVAGPPLVTEAWLRDPANPSRDAKVYMSVMERTVSVQAEEFSPEGAAGAVVLHGAQPNVSRLPLEHWSFNQVDYDAVMTLLTSKNTLHLQRAIGGECWFVRVVGDVKAAQVLSSPLSTEVARASMVHKISANLTVVADREVVTSATVIG